jgi:hypothetical protein
VSHAKKKEIHSNRKGGGLILAFNQQKYFISTLTKSTAAKSKNLLGIKYPTRFGLVIYLRWFMQALREKLVQVSIFI